MDYKKAKIYQILNYIDNEVYVGSTCQPLSKRFSTHKSFMKLKPNIPLYQHMNKYDISNFYIELIEEYPCENKEQLRAREGYYIRDRGTLNKLIAGRKIEEYRKDHYEQNKQEILLHMKEYYQQNKQSKTEKAKEQYHKNKTKVLLTRKNHYELNKESINKKRKEKITCECGVIVQKCNLGDHKSTKKHQQYINQQIQK